MEFSLPSDYERFAKIAELLGEKVEGLSVVEAAYRSVEAVKRLLKDVGIPGGLEAIGVREEDVPRLAEKAMKIQRLLVGSPRPVRKEDAEWIYRRALRYY